MGEAVILKRNGDLIERYWHYNRKKQKGSYKERKIIFISPSILHDKICELESGITLREIFKFMDKNLEFWNLIIGNWCTEIVTEGLLPAPAKKDDGDTVMTHLELYKSLQISVMFKKHSLEGDHDRLEFHGTGYYTEDSKDGNPPWYKKGDKVNLAIEFTPANELADYEVKINPTYELWLWDYDDKRKTKEAMKDNPKKYYPHDLEIQPSLFGILYGIIWELSFCGPPVSRTKQAATLQKSVQDLNKQLKSGKKLKSYKSVDAMLRSFKKRKNKGKKKK